MPTIILRSNCSSVLYKNNTGTHVHHGWVHPKYIEILASGNDPYLRWLTRTDSETMNGTELWNRGISIHKDTGAATVTWNTWPKVWRNDCVGSGYVFADWPRNPATEGDLDWQVCELFRTNSVTAYTYYGDTAAQNAFLNNSLLGMGAGSFYGNPSNTWEDWIMDDEPYVDWFSQVTYCTTLDQTWRYRRLFTNQYTYTQLRADCEAAMVWDADWTEQLNPPDGWHVEAVNKFEPDSNDWPNDANGMTQTEVRIRIMGTEYCLLTYLTYWPSDHFEPDLIECTTTGPQSLDCSTEPCWAFAFSEFDLIAPDWDLGGYDEGTGDYFIHNYVKSLSAGCTECPSPTAASADITADSTTLTADNFRIAPPI